MPHPSCLDQRRASRRRAAKTFTLTSYSFQTPVRVFFAGSDGVSREAFVINVAPALVTGLSPAFDTRGEERQFTVTVVNRAGMPDESRVDSPDRITYFNLDRTLRISGLSPAASPINGGERLTLLGSGLAPPVQLFVIEPDGSGFSDPLSVSVAGVIASPLRVSGTQIVAVTHAIAPTRCEDVSGPVTVTSVETGDSAIGPTFTYVTPRARFVSLPPDFVAGASRDVTIATLTNRLRFAFHDRVVVPSAARDNGDGTTTYTLPIPTDLLFRTRRCRRGDGIVALPLTTSLTVTDRVTTCSATEVVVVQPEISSCQSELPGSDEP